MEKLPANINENEFDENLIEAVSSYKLVYDRKDPGFKSIAARVNAWATIAATLGKTAKQCEIRWRNLRERYGREVRKMEMPSGSGSYRRKPWPHINRMEFLKDHIKSRRNVTNYDDSRGMCQDKMKQEKIMENAPTNIKRNEFDKNLIEAVKFHKLVYDKRKPGFKSKAARANAWATIAATLGSTTKQCETRWRNLRERYGREVRKVEMSSGSGNYHNEPWAHINSMAFLKDHMQSKRYVTYDNSRGLWLDKIYGNEFDENLIETVRSHKLVYAKKYRGFKSRAARANAWATIAAILGKTAKQCETRWKKLRERYVRELRKMEMSSGSGDCHIEPWRHTYRMGFLKDHIQSRPMMRNHSCTLKSIEMEETDSAETSLLEPPATNRKRGTFELPCSRVSDPLDSTDEPAYSAPELPSLDDSFWSLIRNLMSDLPLHAQDKLRTEIFNLTMSARSTHIFFDE